MALFLTVFAFVGAVYASYKKDPRYFRVTIVEVLVWGGFWLSLATQIGIAPRVLNATTIGLGLVLGIVLGVTSTYLMSIITPEVKRILKTRPPTRRD